MSATIGRAIASVVAQSETSWELIVVDDGSTDDSPAIVESFTDHRISLVQQVNAGECAARNSGTEHARAPLVAFLDADDRWEGSHLANLGRLVDDFPDAVLYATAYHLVYESGRGRPVRLRDGTPNRSIMADYFAESVDVEVPICASGVAVRKAALQRIGGFPVGVHAGGDMITWARLTCSGAVAYSTEPTTSVFPPPVAADQRRAALRRPHRPDYVAAALAQLAEDNPERARSIGRYRAWWHRLSALTFAELGEPAESLREISRAIALDRPVPRDGMIALLSVMPSAIRSRLLAHTRLQRRRRDEAGDPSS